MATHSSILAWAEALKLTSYVTQLSAFQQALTELQERTPDPASESSKPLFEPGTEVLIKTLVPTQGLNHVSCVSCIGRQVL